MLCALVAAIAGRALVGQRDNGEQPPAHWFERSPLLLWTLLVGAAVLPNIPSLGIGFLADDYDLIGSARSSAGLLDALHCLPIRVFYRPASGFLWWLGGHLGGWSAVGFHLLGLLLHTANTALLYPLARRYTGSAYGGAMSALLFAVHPYHVEATSWVAAQPDLLCLFFCLLSMWCLERYLGAAGPRPKGLALAGSLAAFALALFTKEVAMAFPGVVFLRLALGSERQLRPAARVTALFGLVLAGYLGVRWLVLGKEWLASYRPALDFWNTVFPSMPLRMVLGFFFPVHQDLFAAVSLPRLEAALLVAMAAGMVWWIRGLEFVPWRRIGFCLGWLVVLSVPAWTLSHAMGVSMGKTRLAYLPCVGLALLFGELHARRPRSRRSPGLAGAATILIAAMLSVWYTAPWRQAAELRDDLLAAGVQAIGRLPGSPPPTAVLVKGLPYYHLGVPVLVNVYGLALSPLLPRPVAIQEVPATPSSLDMLSASDLRPGEYLLRWDRTTRAMALERAGDARASQASPEVMP
jgi:hypothetical protein